jgi:hypothetical protein
MFRATNLECADSGGALDFLALLVVSESKAASRCDHPSAAAALVTPVLAAALQISFSAAC